MGFNVNNAGVNIKVNTYNNVKGGTGNFNNTSYDDLADIDFSRYTPALQRVNFTVSNEVPDLPYTIKDFLVDAYALPFRAKATVVNTGVSLCEGLVSFGEAIFDCGVMLGGVVASAGTAIWDVGNGIFTGDWSFSSTTAVWSKGIMPFVAYNATDTTFDALYSKTPLKYVDDMAYGWAKRENENGKKGWLYSLGEGVGYYTGMLALATVTAGAGTTVAGVSWGGTAVTQGVSVAAGEFGKKGQKFYGAAINQAKEEGRELTMGDVLKTTSQAGVDSLIAGGLHFAAVGVSNIGAGKSLSAVPKINDFVSAAPKAVSTYVVPTVIKSLKPITTAGADYMFTGEFDGQKVAIETAATFIGETAVAGLGGKLAGANWHNTPKLYVPPSPDAALMGSEMEGISEVTKKSIFESAKKLASGAGKKAYEKAIKDALKIGGNGIDQSLKDNGIGVVGGE